MRSVARAAQAPTLCPADLPKASEPLLHMVPPCPCCLLGSCPPCTVAQLTSSPLPPPGQPPPPESPRPSSPPGALLGLAALQGIFSPHPCLMPLFCLLGADSGCVEHNQSPDLHVAGRISDFHLELVRNETCQLPACPYLGSRALLHGHCPWLGTGGGRTSCRWYRDHSLS